MQFPGRTFSLYKSYIDYVRENTKKIEIFKLIRPTDGHYLVLEVLGMPNGKTY